MAGTFDTSIVAEEEIRSNWLTYEQRSLSQKRFATHQTGHTWEIAITTIPMPRSDWQPLLGFMNAQRGKLNTFSYTPKSMAAPLGTLAGSTHAVTVEGSTHTTGNTTVALTGLPNSEIVLKRGDFLKFNDHAKVYAVESTSVTSGSTGDATVTIAPALVAALTTGEAVTYENVVFTMAFNENVPVTPVDTVQLAVMNIGMREVY